MKSARAVPGSSAGGSGSDPVTAPRLRERRIRQTSVFSSSGVLPSFPNLSFCHSAAVGGEVTPPCLPANPTLRTLKSL